MRSGIFGLAGQAPDGMPWFLRYTEARDGPALVSRPAGLAGRKCSLQTMSETTFTSDRGETYLYDTRHLLGSPGRFGRVYAATDIAGTPLAVKEVEIRTDPSRIASEWELVNRELHVARRASERVACFRSSTTRNSKTGC